MTTTTAGLVELVTDPELTWKEVLKQSAVCHQASAVTCEVAYRENQQEYVARIAQQLESSTNQSAMTANLTILESPELQRKLTTLELRVDTLRHCVLDARRNHDKCNCPSCSKDLKNLQHAFAIITGTSVDDARFNLYLENGYDCSNL